MQEYLFSHFSMAGHDGFLKDVSITFSDKTHPSDPLRREDYCRQTLKTMLPYGRFPIVVRFPAIQSAQLVELTFKK